MSDLDGAAPVVRRGEDEWRAIMADYEVSGMTQLGFCESRGLSRKTFQNWRRRLGHPAAVKAGSFVEVAPPSMSGWDIELELGGGMILRLRRF